MADWNAVALEQVRASSMPPPRVSRAMAMTHLAVYDAVNTLDRSRQPYAFIGDLAVYGGADVNAAAATAAHGILWDLFPTRRAQLDASLATSLAAVPDSSSKDRGISLGQAAAGAMLAHRAGDGADAGHSYTWQATPGHWQPTAPAFAPPLLPQWGSVAYFGGNYALPPAPPLLTSVAYATAFNEVNTLGAAGSLTRTAEQTQIAHFWADGAGTETPPGHWNSIARSVAQGRNLSIADSARLFGLLNAAMADAGIQSWDSKYTYDFWRPITAIRDADLDGNPLTGADATWAPLLVTPPFPEYTSGHSTFSGAASAVLADFFGADGIGFTTSSDSLPEVFRSFDSFSDAAAEAGRSRIYGGIHFEFGNQQGLVSGHSIGTYISANLLQVPEPSCATLTIIVAMTLLRRRGARSRVRTRSATPRAAAARASETLACCTATAFARSASSTATTPVLI
ncbi:MAG TPA: vanadium-dependent haloperoxidase [Tepidisphaeraceae bacterium]|nr:vanadium-dependent haloperoxidase [Tepidisphaeraceae bacterium]